MIIDINLKIIFAFLAVFVSVAFAFIPYLRGMIRGDVKPHTYTWLIWTITQGTAIAGLWYGRGGWGAIPLTVGTIFVFLVFLLSFKYGTKNITKSDTMILIAALAAIVVWWQLENPLLAVIMVSSIDVIGYLPSLRKTYHEPQSETITAWVVFSIANLFNIMSLEEYNFLTLTYLLSITSANIILILICLIKRKSVKTIN
ncbi:MAG: hypothetical protein MUC28_00330 [Planctomycetes bacterium]|jgi:hypothetical protein|nr:hypothetical protein [Planctomycetota bacterium]